jgi:hypothetical protein
MYNGKPSVHSNVYHNTMSEATPSAFMPSPDTIDKAFISLGEVCNMGRLSHGSG